MKTVWVGTMAVTFVLGMGLIGVSFLFGKAILSQANTLKKSRKKILH